MCSDTFSPQKKYNYPINFGGILTMAGNFCSLCFGHTSCDSIH